MIMNTEVIPALATKMGIDLNNIKSAEEIQQLKEQAAAAIQQQMGAENGAIQQGPEG